VSGSAKATVPQDVVERISSLPFGTSRGQAQGRTYVASRSDFNGGRSVKVVAEELGGPDYISLNLYHLKHGARLYPCEMPAAKVIAFVRAYTPEAP